MSANAGHGSYVPAARASTRSVGARWHSPRHGGRTGRDPLDADVEALVPLAGPRPRMIINFPTKQHWRSRARLADIEAGLADLVRVAEKHGPRSLAVPAPGAGHGALAWAEVGPPIRRALTPLAGVTVELYRPGR